VLRGAPQIAKFAANIYRKTIHDLEFRPITVNGEPGRAVFYKGVLFSVMTIRTDGHRVLDVFVVMNPEKLQAVHLSH
jgi:RNA polymerase sigma-70 factor (ECF subfamily)